MARLVLPNKEDGVPNLTQMPIKPNTTRLPFSNYSKWHTLVSQSFGFARTNRNVWQFYNAQKSDDKTFRKGIDDLPTVPIVLSEWTDLKPENIHRMLHNANDYPALKKMQFKVMQKPLKARHFKTKLKCIIHAN